MGRLRRKNFKEVSLQRMMRTNFHIRGNWEKKIENFIQYYRLKKKYSKKIKKKKKKEKRKKKKKEKRIKSKLA